jgi:lysozyme
VQVCPHGNAILQGVDVSHWDGTIDWAQTHGAGIEFAIAKATEATDFVDDTFATNRQNAKAAGVVFGAYHFFRADVDPTDQANHFLSVIGSVEPGEIAPVIDVETTDGQSGSTIAQRALTFMQVVQEQTGRVPMIYTSPSFFRDTMGNPGEFADYLLWIANWEIDCPDVPEVWSDWTVWQTADDGDVPGIPTASDLDEIDVSLEELQCAGVTCPGGTCVAGACEGGEGGSAGSAGAGGAASTGGAGGAGGGHGGHGQGASGATGSAGAAADGIAGDDSGCSCRATPSATPRGAMLLGLLAALGGIARRRNPRPGRSDG